MRAAFRAELYRLMRDRWTLFWGFAFVPVLYLLFTAAFDLPPLFAPPRSVLTVDLSLRAAWASAMGGNPFLHLFVAIGAAAIFGGEYRFATWRLVGPRASRGAILAAKMAGLILAAAACLILMIAGSLLIGWASMASASVKVAQTLSLGSVATVFLTSLLELLLIGSLAALLIVATRSSLAGVLPPFLFSLGQAIALSYFQPSPAISPLLVLPAFSTDLIRRWAVGGHDLPVPQGDALIVSVAVLIAWCVVLGAATRVMLARQDWSRE